MLSRYKIDNSNILMQGRPTSRELPYHFTVEDIDWKEVQARTLAKEKGRSCFFFVERGFCFFFGMGILSLECNQQVISRKFYP